jgi:myo-inositol-1-phosphate synthase
LNGDISAPDCLPPSGKIISESVEPIADFLKVIKPMPAVFDQNYVKRLEGKNVKTGKTKRELAEALRKDIRDFKAKQGCDRLVMVWCASTEIFISPGPTHWTLEAFEKAMDANDQSIAPSMLYAYAAIQDDLSAFHSGTRGRFVRDHLEQKNSLWHLG